jgi:hypothetical protein
MKRETKQEDERLQECVELRKQLDKVGVMLDPACREQVSAHMNAFVRDGTPSSACFRVEGHLVHLVLTSRAHKKSGVVLEVASR